MQPDIPDEHEWMRDPEHRAEGLVCRFCGITEAEAEASPRTAASCWPIVLAEEIGGTG